jgi:5-methylcytosine-specific restriction endonuclease McrA
MREKSEVLADVCRAIAGSALEEAVSIAKRDYPFAPVPIITRSYGPVESTRLFIRDGFIDRYTGDRLVFPPVLRILSQVLPNEFPYHPNWKTDLTHPSYWEVGATVDHIVPVTRGGADDESNWVTTSMARNSAKMNWSLTELGWTLHPPGDVKQWDGLVGWFLRYTAAHPSSVTTAIRGWHRAASAIFATSPGPDKPSP